MSEESASLKDLVQRAVDSMHVIDEEKQMIKSVRDEAKEAHGIEGKDFTAAVKYTYDTAKMDEERQRLDEVEALLTNNNLV